MSEDTRHNRDQKDLASLLEFDKKNIWHPYTSLTKPLNVYPVVSAHQNYLVLDDEFTSKEKTVVGRNADGILVDGMSSWWCAVHGYNHPYINNALHNQISKMSHVMFGGITHRPAMELCQRLVEITPKGLNKIFLCDSGSVSVEVAIKIALQYQMARHRSEGGDDGAVAKSKVISLRRGYHGDTFGAMSVCDPETGMHHIFRSTLAQQIFVPAPVTPFHEESLRPDDLRALERVFADHAHEAAAFVLEPIVQGAGGMRTYGPAYLRRARELCRAHDVLLIADEIATGFGRTGRLFACEHANDDDDPCFAPDVLCLGKALTGGTVTMAATLCTDAVAETVCDADPGVLMHGPTFMGNPLACAAALASLELLLDGEHGDGDYNGTGRNWVTTVKGIERTLARELVPLKSHARVKDVRVLGAIGVVECHDVVNVGTIQKFFVDSGVWIRPFNKLIYIMPPFITGEEDLKILCAAIQHSLDIDSHFLT